MSRKQLKQYLELLSFSGIDSLSRMHQEGSNEDAEVEDIQLSAIDKSSNQSGDDKGLTTDKSLLLDEKRQAYKDCTDCELHHNRINFVYGEGNANADLMLIGEGPGSEENKQGKPFVGRAGDLLTKMLAAIQLNRNDVFIANVVKCQPPANRNPLPEEVRKCLPYLWEQIEIINPSLIVLLGKVAASALLGIDDTLGKMRLNQYRISIDKRCPVEVNDRGDYQEGVETYVTYHPAALLRNPSLKKLSWIDLQKYRDILKANLR